MYIHGLPQRQKYSHDYQKQQPHLSLRGLLSQLVSQVTL